MANNIYYTLTLFVAILLCVSCVEEISINPKDEKPKIAVSCLLTNSDIQKLTLTWSKAINSGYFFDEVTEAKASLYEDSQLIGVFDKTAYAEWTLACKPEENKTYRIEVEVSGYPKLAAQTTMPAGKKIMLKGVSDKGKNKLFQSQFIPTPYWIFAMQSSLKDPVYIVQQPSLEKAPSPQLFQQISTDHTAADRFNQENSVSDNGSGYGHKLLSYKYYVRVPPSEADKTMESLFSVQHPQTETSFIVFRYCSVEYDRYLKSVMEKKTFYESEDDPAAWFDESVIYTNIENGLGIFGAYHQDSFYFNNTIIEQ